MVAADAFEVFRVEVPFDHRPVAQHEGIAVDSDQVMPDVMPVGIALAIERIGHRIAWVGHSGFTLTACGSERSIRIGFRRARPKPRKATTMTSPSSSLRRSLK